MVLSENEIEIRKKEINHKGHNFMILDVEHNRYDTLYFSQAIELLNICNILNKVNKIYLKLNSEKEINLNILYKAIQAILSNEYLNKKDLIEYFTLHREIRKFHLLIDDISDIGEKLYISPSVDLHLLGFNLKNEKDIRFSHIHTDLFDDYSDIFDNMAIEEMEILPFLKEANKIIEIAKEKRSLEVA